MIGELDVPSNAKARLHRSYAWDLDASGTLTGAGGAGGLVLTSHHTPHRRTDRKTGGAVWDVWYQESNEVGLSFSWGDLGLDGPSRESADVRGITEVLLTCECVAK